ncbi:hypothetical protein [Lysinibacillus sphaericus]|uniref:hypothetical protein n=1 Tax=Lysinibacillus sphaericus TaxID=1421 RepID=UPI00163B898D|nr:hypothetical protein [Lysinibacillus sp. SDF0037]
MGVIGSVVEQSLFEAGSRASEIIEITVDGFLGECQIYTGSNTSRIKLIILTVY